MSEPTPWFRFLLAVLATWRVTHLLAREDGPFDVLLRARSRLGQGFLAKLFDCFLCLSIWVAAPIAWHVFPQPLDRVLGWLALSGATCLIDQIARKPVVIQPFSTSTEKEAN